MLSHRDDVARELLDANAIDDAVLRRNLRDIRTINGLLGWRALAVREVARLVHGRGLGSFSLLDVASGSGDIPLAIARWAARNALPARIVATDVSPQIIAVTRELLAGAPAVHVERADALALPYPTGAFDVALCTLALHHFPPESAVTLLTNLARVGRDVIVFDAARAPAAYGGVWLLTRLLGMDAMTRHDAPMSVRRAYTLPELRGLARAAGLVDARTWEDFPYRLALVASAAV